MAKDVQKQHLSVQPAAASSQAMPPVVAVLGHVDHGKTTLLDTIRTSDVAGREHGGITQHIGAYQIALAKTNLPAGGQKSKKVSSGKPEPDSKAHSAKRDQEAGRFITFIDTPGHETFSKMRSRGAQVADIAILVVAADDSVKPQTVESIEQIKKAGIPMIVAINKIDLPAANVDRVKSDLAKAGVQVEGFGGDVAVALVSAKQGTGVPELLDLILLVSDLQGLRGDSTAPLQAVVVETKRDKARGMTATLLVKNGTLKPAALLYLGSVLVGKVRAMTDEHKKNVEAAGPGKPVEIMGFSKLPDIGATLTQVPGSREETNQQPLKKQVSQMSDFLAAMDDAAKKRLSLILKADTSGSLEAIVEALPGDQMTYVRRDLGDITEGDILDAKASKSLIVGFNVKVSPNIEKLARIEKVVCRTYTIIYELIDELRDVLEGLEEVLSPERELGHGQIVAEFPFEGLRVAGTKVVSGRLARGDTVKIVRNEEEIARVKIKSMRRGKDDVTKIEAGGDCGILLDKKVDFSLGDAIIAVTT